MLIYANQLHLHGNDSEDILIGAITRWLKKQTGIQFDQSQLISSGKYDGRRGKIDSTLTIFGCYDNDPPLCSWILRHPDDEIEGRIWSVEISVRKLLDKIEISCVVRKNEHSAWESNPVSASQPRLFREIISDIDKAKVDVSIAKSTPGYQGVRPIGRGKDDFRGFLFEIEHKERFAPIVIVSSTEEKKYLVYPKTLQETLIGLAEVFKVNPQTNRNLMEQELGKDYTVSDGAICVVSPPRSNDGDVSSKIFDKEMILGWGGKRDRTSKILAWVTAQTNIRKLRNHIQPAYVQNCIFTNSIQGHISDLSEQHTSKINEMARQYEEDREVFFDDLVNEKEQLDMQLQQKDSELWKCKSQIEALEHDLSSAKKNQLDIDECDQLLGIVFDYEYNPNPQECLTFIEKFYSDRCTILSAANKSAQCMEHFELGRKLLKLLNKLVTEYRDILIEKGDSEARKVFGGNVFASKESDPVMKNPKLRSYREFDYEGEKVQMFSHVKIGIRNDVNKTIRIHFYWDNQCQKIIIGHCGKHLPLK